MEDNKDTDGKKLINYRIILDNSLIIFEPEIMFRLNMWANGCADTTYHGLRIAKSLGLQIGTIKSVEGKRFRIFLDNLYEKNGKCGGYRLMNSPKHALGSCPSLYATSNAVKGILTLESEVTQDIQRKDRAAIAKQVFGKKQTKEIAAFVRKLYDMETGGFYEEDTPYPEEMFLSTALCAVEIIYNLGIEEEFSDILPGIEKFVLSHLKIIDERAAFRIRLKGNTYLSSTTYYGTKLLHYLSQGKFHERLAENKERIYQFLTDCKFGPKPDFPWALHYIRFILHAARYLEGASKGLPDHRNLGFASRTAFIDDIVKKILDTKSEHGHAFGPGLTPNIYATRVAVELAQDIQESCGDGSSLLVDRKAISKKLEDYRVEHSFRG